MVMLLVSINLFIICTYNVLKCNILCTSFPNKHVDIHLTVSFIYYSLSLFEYASIAQCFWEKSLA